MAILARPYLEARLTQMAEVGQHKQDLVGAIGVLMGAGYPGSASAVVVAYEKAYGPLRLDFLPAEEAVS